MTREMRWRIIALQAVLVLGFSAGFLFGGSSFINGMVHDELVAQKIHFPPAGSSALSPTEFPDLQQYAGQQVDNGAKRRRTPTASSGAIWREWPVARPTPT